MKNIVINFCNDKDLEDNLTSLKSSTKRRKLLFNWVKDGKITFEQFDKLICYIQ